MLLKTSDLNNRLSKNKNNLITETAKMKNMWQVIEPKEFIIPSPNFDWEAYITSQLRAGYDLGQFLQNLSYGYANIVNTLRAARYEPPEHILRTKGPILEIETDKLSLEDKYALYKTKIDYVTSKLEKELREETEQIINSEKKKNYYREDEAYIPRNDMTLDLYALDEEYEEDNEIDDDYYL